MEDLLNSINDQLVVKNGLLYIGEERLGLLSSELDIIVNDFWDKINSEIKNKIIEYNLETKFINSLKYNLYLDFEESKKIFFSASPEYNSDFNKFMFTSFKWLNSSNNEKIENFLNWFNCIFHRLPTLNVKKILSDRCFDVRYIEIYSYRYQTGIWKVSLQNYSKPIEYFNDIEFQIEYLGFETLVDNGFVYMIDDLHYYKNKRFISDKDIELMTPPDYYEKLEELGVWDDYVREVLEYYTKSLIPPNMTPYEYYKDFTSRKFKNFADFVFDSFYWSLGKHKFSWWYKTVFGFDFKYKGYGFTIKQVQENIDNYKESDGYRSNYSEPDDTYTSRDAFIDAYSDGFSSAEDNYYFYNDDSVY